MIVNFVGIKFLRISLSFLSMIIHELLGVVFKGIIFAVQQGGGMSSQLVKPNLTLRTMQLNTWVSDNYMNIKILFLPLIL